MLPICNGQDARGAQRPGAEPGPGLGRGRGVAGHTRINEHLYLWG